MGGVNPATKSVPYQSGQQAAVVDMGMGKKNSIDSSRIKGEIMKIPAPQFLSPLEHAAVDEHLSSVEAEEKG